MTTPNFDPAQFAAFQAFQAQLAAQQGTAPAAGIPVTPAAPVVEPAPTVPVDLGETIDQATAARGYGPALFKTKTDEPGLAFTFKVAGPTKARQRTDYDTKEPLTFQDGRPKPELLIPLNVDTSERHPDGQATLYARGSLISELARAMAEGGADAATVRMGPETDATGSITYLGKVDKRGSQGKTYTENTYRIVYVRPGQPVAQVAAVAAPAAVVQPVTPAPVAGPARPEGLTDEQYALYQKALGQAA